MKNIENKLDNLTSSDELNNLKKEVAKSSIEDVERDDIKSDLDSLKKSVLAQLQREKLKKNEKAENIDDQKVEAIFKKWIEELGDTNERWQERRFVRKMNRVNMNNVTVKEEKEKSFDRVLSSITRWKGEKNPVAKVLLRMADRVLSTEK